MTKPKKEKILEIRDIVLSGGKVCDHCLGRQVSLKFLGIPCEKIGAALRKAKSEKEVNIYIKKKLAEKKEKKCFVCGGLFEKIKSFDKKLKEAVAKEEFTSFQPACRIPLEIPTAEETLWAKTGPEFCEPAKREINRIVGEKILKLCGKKKAKVDLVYPDAIFLIDFTENRVEIIRNPLFLYGRYKKFVFIPQTKWPCRDCRGRGCEKCGFTGKQYPETVEELVAEKVLEKTKGRKSKFHGLGREDISARMLGTGRPFVLEIVEPQKRFFDLKKLEKEINALAKGKVEISGLRPSNMKEVQYIKTIAPHKKYECLVECEKTITKEDLEKIEKFFKNKQISQKTPQRVLHRRADKVRKRKVLFTKCDIVSDDQFKATIETEAGTYIKELISGDDGRTVPSFTSVLGAKCLCKELDVVEIKVD